MKPAAQPLTALLSGFATQVPAVMVSGLALDSRRVTRGGAFLALRGTREHGLAHLPQALARGASAIVWEPAASVTAPLADVPCVAVEQLTAHAGEIASRFFGEPSRQLHVVGITGTDGKTSTAHLVAQAFETLGKPCAYLGTLGSGRLGQLAEATHTTPDPVALQARLAQFVAEGVQHCAMEVSSHALDQNRVGGLHFDTAVLTNVTRDHLDYHGTVEAYAAAKRRLFEAADGRALIFNRDDATGRQWAEALPGSVVYGLEGETPASGAYLLGRNLQLHPAGLSLDIASSWGQAHLATRLLGRFNAYNLLAALAALLAAGVPLAAAIAALSEVRTVPGRIEGFRGPDAAPLVVVDYAHTPQALEQILAALRAHTRGELLCVFGCGGDRDRGKRPLMGGVASRLADRVILTDDNPRSEDPAGIVAEIRAGMTAPDGPAVSMIHDRAAAIRQAVALAGAEDVVLIAGKGHESTQTYGFEVRAFSDRAFVANLLGSPL